MKKLCLVFAAISFIDTAHGMGHVIDPEGFKTLQERFSQSKKHSFAVDRNGNTEVTALLNRYKLSEAYKVLQENPHLAPFCNNAGSTPLHLALNNNVSPLALLCINLCSQDEVNSSDVFGNSSLLIAAVNKSHDIYEHLIQKSPVKTILTKNEAGLDPLKHAINVNDTKLAYLIIQKVLPESSISLTDHLSYAHTMNRVEIASNISEAIATRMKNAAEVK